MKKTENCDLAPESISLRIGVPLADWESKCCFVCAKIIRTGVVSGALVSGVYSVFSDGAAKKTTHCWIRLEDGTIMDPTFWILEGEEPSVYLGVEDMHYSEASLIPMPLDIHWSF